MGSNVENTHEAFFPLIVFLESKLWLNCLTELESLRFTYGSERA